MFLYEKLIYEAFSPTVETMMAPVLDHLNSPPILNDSLCNYPNDWFIIMLNHRPTTLPIDSEIDAKVYLSRKGYLENKEKIIQYYSKVYGKENTFAQNEEIIERMFVERYKFLSDKTMEYILQLEKELDNASKLFVKNLIN